MKIILALVAFSAASFSLAEAAEIVDQSQPLIDEARGFLGIGGAEDQKLAQTFVAGVSGDLVALRLPIVGCGGADLVIEVREAAPDGTPVGALLNETRVDPASVSPVLSGLHEFRLSSAVPMYAGVRYAFVTRMALLAPTSFCNYAHGPVGDLYLNGTMFFDTRPNPPGWLDSATAFGGAADLAFETIVDAGASPVASNDCIIRGAGGGSVPIPADAPVCRCLRDDGLREFRCAILHPDFFAIRRIPWPIPLDRSYTESWEVLPMTKLDSAIRIDLKGADIAQTIGLTFTGKSVRAIEMRKAVLKAPAKPVTIPATATIIYGDEIIGVDRSVPAAQFGDLPLKDRLPISDAIKKGIDR